MDNKKKLYILIAALAVILVACLILIPVLKAGSADENTPGTTQGVDNGETEDNGGEGNSDTTETTGNSGTGNGSTGNGGTGNGSTGNGSTGNGGTGNGSTGNGGTGNGGSGDVDIDISFEMDVEDKDDDFGGSPSGNQGNTGTSNPTEGTEDSSNVIRFPDLVEAGKK